MAKVSALCQEALKRGRFGRQLSTYFTTTRYLTRGFFFSLFCFFWALQKQIFPSKFPRKNLPRCEKFAPKMLLYPHPPSSARVKQ